MATSNEHEMLCAFKHPISSRSSASAATLEPQKGSVTIISASVMLVSSGSIGQCSDCRRLRRRPPKDGLRLAATSVDIVRAQGGAGSIAGGRGPAAGGIQLSKETHAGGDLCVSQQLLAMSTACRKHDVVQRDVIIVPHYADEIRLGVQAVLRGHRHVEHREPLGGHKGSSGGRPGRANILIALRALQDLLRLGGSGRWRGSGCGGVGVEVGVEFDVDVGVGVGVEVGVDCRRLRRRAVGVGVGVLVGVEVGVEVGVGVGVLVYGAGG
eukprot:scaffold176432_cov45-Prasinocladus_malaysianus.AAC.1